MSRFRFVYVVFCLTAVLIVTVYLRTVENRMFYKICVLNSEICRLRQELGKKQLQLESLINPAAISGKLNE